MELKCKHCGRYLGKADTIVGVLTCPNCGGETEFSIIVNDTTELMFKEFKNLKQPKESWKAKQEKK